MIAAMRNDCEKATQLLTGGVPDTVHVWPNMPVKIPIQEAVDVDERDSQGWTPLMTAAVHGHLEMCQLLIDRQADVLAKKSFKCSALHLACRAGHKEIAELLLVSKANPHGEKLDKSLPLHDAASCGHVEIARLLVQHGHSAATGIVPHGQNPKHRRGGGDMLKHVTDMGHTPLHLACRNGHPLMVKALLAMGANMHVKDEQGKFPLDLAKNRATLLAFPEAEDPVEVSLQEVGAMSRDVTERKKQGALSALLGTQTKSGRPRTGDVSTFTNTLGIVRGRLQDDGGVAAHAASQAEQGL